MWALCEAMASLFCIDYLQVVVLGYMATATELVLGTNGWEVSSPGLQ